MSDSTPARFAFKGKDLDVEFEGRADFVTAQVQHFREAMLRSAEAGTKPAEAPAAAAAAAPAASAAPAAAPTGTQSLEDFYKRAKSRSGRGALQETILIFAYFLRQHRDMEEFGIENLNACFSLVGVQPPKSLANTMGIMKRNLKLFHSGSRRGTYTLTEKGLAYVKKLAGE
jgi:hypothetical protein